MYSTAADANPALGGSPGEYYYTVREVALGELSCTRYLKTKVLLAKSVGDTLSTCEFIYLFIYFNDPSKPTI